MSDLEQYNRRIAENLVDRARKDLKAVLDTAPGRRLVWSILASAGVYGRSFTGDALASAFNEGRREVGIALLEQIETEQPGAYLTMMREALDETTQIENGRKIAAENDAKAAE